MKSGAVPAQQVEMPMLRRHTVTVFARDRFVVARFTNANAGTVQDLVMTEPEADELAQQLWSCSSEVASLRKVVK